MKSSVSIAPTAHMSAKIKEELIEKQNDILSSSIDVFERHKGTSNWDLGIEKNFQINGIKILHTNGRSVY